MHLALVCMQSLFFQSHCWFKLLLNPDAEASCMQAHKVSDLNTYLGSRSIVFWHAWLHIPSPPFVMLKMKVSIMIHLYIVMICYNHDACLWHGGHNQAKMAKE